MPNATTLETVDRGRCRLTVVVPCYNEEEVLPFFFAAVIPRLEEATEGEWRVLCVDDGSKDETSAVIAREHLRDPRVIGIRLSRNFGHQPAVSVGLAYASGDYIGILDCDLQDPVEVLIQLYRNACGKGLDICYGVRRKRDAPLLLKSAYYLFYRLVRRLSEHEWPVDAGDFCVISARCQAVLLSLPERSRLLRGLRGWVGLRQEGLPYDRPARKHGTSKYNLPKLMTLALQGLIAFSSLPLRLATAIGVAMAAFSILFGLVVLINRLFPAFTILRYWVGANPGVTTILLFISLVSSMGFICLGIIGEYMVVVLEEIKRRPAAVVASITGDVSQKNPAYQITQAMPETEAPEAARAGRAGDARGGAQ